MNIIFRVALVTLCILPCCASAQHLESVTTGDVVERLIQAGYPVCFEEITMQMKDAITLKQRLEEIQSIPEGERTHDQKMALAHYLQSMSKGNYSSCVVGWRDKRFAFDLPGNLPDTDWDIKLVLDSLIADDSRYQWQAIGSKFVIVPRVGAINTIIAGFHAHNLGRPEYMRAISEQVAKPADLNLGEMVMFRPWWEGYEDSRYSLDLGRMDVITALTRISETLLPTAVWWISGCKENGGINLSFTRVR